MFPLSSLIGQPIKPDRKDNKMNKIKDITIISACKTINRINRQWKHNAITYEEYVQSMSDSKQAYLDMIKSFEDFSLISESDSNDLKVYIIVRFTE